MIAAALLTATTVCAAENSELTDGIALAKAGNYSQAIPLLRMAVEAAPDNAEANYYLGLALNRTTPNKEAESYLKHSLMENPEDPGLNFELGTHYFNKDVHAEAADYFEQVIQSAPKSELAAKAAEYLRKIDEKKQVKAWDLSVFAGAQYDTNVMLNGRGMPLPAGFSGKSDWSALVNLKGSYSPVKSDQTEVAIGYGFYQNLHASLNDFDIMQNVVDLTAVHAVNNSFSLKGVYSFEYLLLDGKDYDYAHSLAPSLLLKSELGTTTVDYRFRRTYYQDSDKFPTNSDRNGNNHLFGFSHILPFSDTAAAWVLYTHDIELTKISEWDYDGNHLLLGVRSILPFNITGDVSGDIYWKDYRGFDTLYGATRHDAQYTISVTLTKNFTESYSVSLSEVLSRNNSNIPEFSYDRSMTSLLFNAKF